MVHKKDLPLDLAVLVVLEELRELAENLAEKGLLDEAIIIFKGLIRLGNKDVYVYTDLGHVYQDKGELDTAEKYYRKAIRANPRNVDAYDLLGTLFTGKGDLVNGIKYYEKGLRRKPDDFVLLVHVGKAFYDLNLLEKAREVLEKASKQRTTANLCNTLGLVYSKLDLKDKAVEALKKATDLQPNDWLFHANLGYLYFELERWSEAREEYLKWIELDPKSAVAHNNLGAAYARMEESSLATKEFKTAIEIDPDFELAKSNLQNISEHNGKQSQYEVFKKKDNFIVPDDPYGNRKKLDELLRKCQTFIHWFDKYFSTEGLDALYETLYEKSPTSVREIKILCSPDAIYNKSTGEVKLKNSFQRFSASMASRGIKCEMRVLLDSKILRTIHDRWILTGGKFFTLPSTDTIARGQWSQIFENTQECQIPFNDWWVNAKDIFREWSAIEANVHSWKKY